MTEEWPNQVETIIRTNEGKSVFERFWVENGRTLVPARFTPPWIRTTLRLQLDGALPMTQSP